MPDPISIRVRSNRQFQSASNEIDAGVDACAPAIQPRDSTPAGVAAAFSAAVSNVSIGLIPTAPAHRSQPVDLRVLELFQSNLETMVSRYGDQTMLHSSNLSQEWQLSLANLRKQFGGQNGVYSSVISAFQGYMESRNPRLTGGVSALVLPPPPE